MEYIFLRWGQGLPMHLWMALGCAEHPGLGFVVILLHPPQLRLCTPMYQLFILLSSWCVGVLMKQNRKCHLKTKALSEALITPRPNSLHAHELSLLGYCPPAGSPGTPRFSLIQLWSLGKCPRKAFWFG